MTGSASSQAPQEPPLLLQLKPKASPSANPENSCHRPSALGARGRNKRNMSGKAAPLVPSQRIPNSSEARAQAAHNATELEFAAARKAIEELVTRSMSAAEAGVRLRNLLHEHPDLLAARPSTKQPNSSTW